MKVGRVRYRGTLALLGATACVLASAAIAGGERSTAPRRGGTVEVAFFVQPGGIDSIDPAFPGSPWRERLLRPSCAQLMSLPGPKPEVAAGYPSRSPDRRTYTFRIRKGLRFNTGERVTGRSFARAFERALSPELRLGIPPDYAGIYVGGRAYFAGRAERIRGVVGHRNTLVVRLTREFPELLDELASRFFCAVPARLPVNPEGIRAPLASAGPYYVSQYVPGRLVVLARNQRYRGPRPQHVDRYRIDLANTPPAAVEQVTSGRADLAVPFSFQYTELAARYGVNRSRFFLFADGTVLQALIINTDRALFRDNAKLRSAVGFAIDRRALIRAFSPHYGSPSDQFLSPGVAGFRDVKIYPPRAKPGRARALANGRKRSGKAVLYVDTTATESTVQAQLVRQQLRQIGLDVEVRAFPGDVFFSKIQKPGEPFDMALVRHELPRASGGVLSCWFHGRNIPTPTAPGCNLSRFNSRQFNRRLAQAERLVGRPSFERFGRLDVDLARAAPAIPITHPARAVIVSRRVGCHRFGRPLLDLAAVCLKR